MSHVGDDWLAESAGCRIGQSGPFALFGVEVDPGEVGPRSRDRLDVE